MSEHLKFVGILCFCLVLGLGLILALDDQGEQISPGVLKFGDGSAMIVLSPGEQKESAQAKLDLLYPED